MYSTDFDSVHPAVQEWLDSGVDPGIIDLNVQVVSGRAAIELLLSNQIERLQRNTSYVTAPVARLLDRYANLEDGGWWVSGVDPLNGYERMEWGQLKPNTPRLNENGKLIKYDGPPGEPTRAIFLDVPPALAERVYVQAGINPTPEHRALGFWHCVQHYGIPIVLTEGAKKAGAVLTAGFPAIALPGIWNGRRVDRDGRVIYDEGLIPELEFFNDGRTIIFCFDRDEKRKTRRDVAKAICATSTLFESAGCECLVARWSPDWGKGIDDVAHVHGHDRVVTLILEASSLDDQTALAQLYKADGSPAGFTVIPGGLTEGTEESSAIEQRERLIRKRDTLFRTLRPHLEKDFKITSTRDGAITYYQGYAPSFTLNHRTIFLRGWLGAGKTEATLRSLLPYQDRQIIWLSNRNGLLRQTLDRATRMGHANVYHYQDNPVTHREALRDGYPGLYTMCPDSLKDYATKYVNWSKAILVVDEFASIRKEILHNSTVMPEFERLLTEAQHAVAVDAFLGSVDVQVLAQYRGQDRQILDQSFTESLKRVYWLETRTDNGCIALSHDGIAYPLVKQWVEAGHRFVITTDSKLLAKALHDYLKSLGVEGVLCTSETITTNQALLSNPDAQLQNYQVLTYTPAAQNGLDVQTPFDKGLALYHGIVSPLDFMQMMGRPRQCAEWYVSAPRRTLDTSGAISSLSPAKFERWQERVSQTLEDLGAVHALRTDAWSVWQAATGQIHATFASEYLHWLLEEFFTSVETIEVEANRSQWRDDIQRIKDQEAVLTLEANLQNGQQLLRLKKSPGTDAEVWDVALAEAVAKRPKIWRRLVERYQEAENKAEAIALARLFLSPRIERLKRWVSVSGEKSSADLDRGFAFLRRRFTSYLSPQFREAQYRLMFTVLQLGKLAQIGLNQDADEAEAESSESGKERSKHRSIAHENQFRFDSPKIYHLWQQFRQHRKLQKMFALVDDLATFWGAVKRCMSYFGYESAGTSIRVNTPGKWHKNGYDRTGKPRLSESTSLHFLGWIVMAASGSELFRENFALIVEALEEELEFERRLWEQNLERQQGPPLAA